MKGPIPARVPGAVKEALLGLIDKAVDAGWSLQRICGVLELDRQRAWRWQARRQSGTLDDGQPGGNPIHGLPDWEVAEILALFDQWGGIDLSHRKLAHRCCHENRVWCHPPPSIGVLPATASFWLVRTALHAPRRLRGPSGASGARTTCGAGDASQFEACEASKYAYGIIDLVSRKRVAVTLTPEPNSTSARVLFLKLLKPRTSSPTTSVTGSPTSTTTNRSH